MITADSDGFAKSSFKIGKKKKLMPLSRPIRNLTKFTQIPHLASGMLLQDLPCLVLPCSSSSNCRNRLQSCSLCSRCRFFLGGGGGARGAKREIPRSHARKWRSQERACERAAKPRASPLSHSTRHLACLRTQAKPAEVKNVIVLVSKTITLCVHHANLYISLPSCTTTTWNDQSFCSVENINAKAFNFTVSLYARTPSPVFSSSLFSWIFRDLTSWNNPEKVWKDAKSVSHWRCQ